MEQKYLDQLVAVDLHVHTPASSCYKRTNPDLEAEYIDILKRYIEKDIKVIGITDHNSIEGYKELIRIKKQAEEKIRAWQELANIPGVQNKIDEERLKLDLFSKILLIPGVEFEANPGVHILFLFNPSISTDEIEKFICDNGYGLDNQGKEEVEVATISAIEIIKKGYSLGAITIAAHIDSSKGILKVIPKGSSKAQLFRSEYLLGLQVVKLSTIEYLRQLYKNEEYKREKLPAFIRCSDYHNDFDDVDKYVTYMRLPAIEFKYIMETIKNNTECISFTANIEQTDTLKLILEQQDTYTFENFSEENIIKIKETLCGILNNRKGTIIVGIGNNRSICGVKMDKSQMHSIVNSIIDTFQEKSIYFRFTVDYYELGNHIVNIIKVKAIGSIVFDVDGKVYILENQKVKLANPQDLVKIGERNFKSSFRVINEINEKRIELVKEQLKLVSQFKEHMELYRKIYNESLKASDIFDIDVIKPNVGKESNIRLDSLNFGKAEGNCYFVNFWKNAHQKDCYLRVTCPVDSFSLEDIKIKKLQGEYGVISLGGAVHYIDNRESEFNIFTEAPLIIFKVNDAYKDYYSLRTIILWLKSPILLYYLNLIYGTYRFFDPNIVFDIPIVLTKEMKVGSVVDEKAKEIIQLEKKFLQSASEKVESALSPEQEEEFNKEILNHNNTIANIIANVEEIFMNLFDLSKEEYSLITEFVEQEQWESIRDGLNKILKQ